MFEKARQKADELMRKADELMMNAKQYCGERLDAFNLCVEIEGHKSQLEDLFIELGQFVYYKEDVSENERSREDIVNDISSKIFCIESLEKQLKELLVKQDKPSDNMTTPSEIVPENSQEVVYCSKCGKPHPMDDSFCSKCGAKLNK